MLSERDVSTVERQEPTWRWLRRDSEGSNRGRISLYRNPEREGIGKTKRGSGKGLIFTLNSSSFRYATLATKAIEKIIYYYSSCFLTKNGDLLNERKMV